MALSSTDPLTEARDALRRALYPSASDLRDPVRRHDALDSCAAVLKRLDALPAPIRCEHLKDNMPLFTGWGYPDAEAAS